MYTIGHSTRSLEEFLDLLRDYEVQVLLDVRRWPASKRNPVFNRNSLDLALQHSGLGYVWLGEQLGGFRREGLGEESPNKGWKSVGFRNYADHLLTEQFRIGVRKLLDLAEKGRVAYMCAERLYWRCHRRILSDYLKATGHRVAHIIERGETREHEFPKFAQVSNGELSYP